MLINVINHLLPGSDSGAYSILILLDLNFAFCMVDHNILINCLEYCDGIQDTALAKFFSYVSDRSICVVMRALSSYPVPRSFGVPQGSILDPKFISIYIAPLGLIIPIYSINFHYYAEDTGLYVLLTSDKFSYYGLLL